MKKYLTPDEIKKLSPEDMLKITCSDSEPQPTFSPKNTSYVHNLFYSWHGILSDKIDFPPTTENIIKQCIPLWKKDGFEFLHATNTAKPLQILFKVQPNISPEKLTQKVKGRLLYAFRQSGIYLKFSRALGFRSLGFNTSKIVKDYIDGQVEKEDLADNRYKEILKQFTSSDNKVHFNDPHKNKRSRYWYNIHLVIVIADRGLPITKDAVFKKIKEIIPLIAKKHCHYISDFAVMPDHIHIAMQANPEKSPQEIGLSFLNNLAYMMKMAYFWSNELYVGTFSEYTLKDLGVKTTSIPTRQARG